MLGGQCMWFKMAYFAGDISGQPEGFLPGGVAVGGMLFLWLRETESMGSSSEGGQAMVDLIINLCSLSVDIYVGM
eukprot:15365618-Ditylum_brightwellii.AAC.1